MLGCDIKNITNVADIVLILKSSKLFLKIPIIPHTTAATINSIIGTNAKKINLTE
jgi:hypothetical protein